MVGMFEYEVDLAQARSSDDMQFVADAYRAGSIQQAEKIISALEKLSRNGHLSEGWFRVEKIIRGTVTKDDSK